MSNRRIARRPLPFWFTEALAGLGFVAIVVSLLFVTALFSA